MVVKQCKIPLYFGLSSNPSLTAKRIFTRSSGCSARLERTPPLTPATRFSYRTWRNIELHADDADAVWPWPDICSGPADAAELGRGTVAATVATVAALKQEPRGTRPLPRPPRGVRHRGTEAKPRDPAARVYTGSVLCSLWALRQEQSGHPANMAFDSRSFNQYRKNSPLAGIGD